MRGEGRGGKGRQSEGRGGEEREGPPMVGLHPTVEVLKNTLGGTESEGKGGRKGGDA